MDRLSPDSAFALMQAGQTDSTKAADKINQAGKTRDQDKIAKAAQEFEAVFITEMMKPMFEGISTEAPFGGGRGEEVFRSMMLQEYGKLLAQTGEVGIADNVRTEMIRLQEATELRHQLDQQAKQTQKQELLDNAPTDE